ncbi:MAG: ThuA domain-containing protein [Candidatus Firestonebacteria bacterium]|nr:ThuA domain-containing protein [Candidatus Firestonebacteria bacterium]
MRKALIVWGGWNGHEPQKVAERFEKFLKEQEFEVEVATNLDVFLDAEKIKNLHLIVPVWTMGKITKEQCNPVIEAVANGTGIAGCHGGMCDAFRESVNWQFMTGGNWVSHPGSDQVEYMVDIKNSSSPLTFGINSFKVKSEQYYLHVDPAVEVLAVTRFPTVKWYHSSNGVVDMPVVWTKKWGVGRVFYSSLGHHDDAFETPEAFELMKRGLLYAAEGKDYALKNGLTSEIYKNSAKMF